MDYQSSKYFANKWGITERRVIKLCKDGRIDGAIRNSLTWMIPENALKPADKRSKMSKYLSTQKKVLVLNNYEPIAHELESQVKLSGYQVENRTCKYTYRELKTVFEQSDMYYDGLIMFCLDNIGNNTAMENFIKLFSEKMHFSSSIVIVASNIKDSEEKQLIEISSDIMNQSGVRLNILNIKAAIKKDIIINYDEITQDIVLLLTQLGSATGNIINTNANSIILDSHGKSRTLNIGRYYRTLDYLYNKLNQNSHVWTAQIVMEDDWSEDALEMQYRKLVVQASYICKMENIFVVANKEIPYIKNSNLYKIYENSNILITIVDLDELTEKNLSLLATLGNGWTGIDEDLLIVNDIKDSQNRGYINKNSEVIAKSKQCFNELKKFGKDLKKL